jgi:hypothetical protein
MLCDLYRHRIPAYQPLPLRPSVQRRSERSRLFSKVVSSIYPTVFASASGLSAWGAKYAGPLPSQNPGPWHALAPGQTT